ncbi:ribonuclease P protein component [Actinomyces sp. F1_1611]
MLPRQNRLVESAAFKRALRVGARGGNRFLAATIAVPPVGTAICHPQKGEAETPVRVGLIVAKREVPTAVARNRLKRQLRHLMRPRLGNFDPGTDIVLRVFGRCQGLSSTELALHLDKALAQAQRKLLGPQAMAKGRS